MHYVPFAFDPQSAEFASLYEEIPTWSAPFGALMMQFVPLRPNMCVLDTGTGTGYPLFQLAYSLGPSAQLIGIDVWAAALQRAYARKNYFDLSQVTLLRSDVGDLPFADETFDLITSCLGINNFADRDHVLQAIIRVLKPGGRIALVTNTSGHMKVFYDALYQAVDALNRQHYHQRVIDEEARRGSLTGLQKWFDGFGLTITRTETANTIMRFADGRAFFHHPLIRYAFLPTWLALIDPSDHQTVFADVQRRLDALAAEMGELRVTVPMVYIEAHKPTS